MPETMEISDAAKSGDGSTQNAGIPARCEEIREPMFRFSAAKGKVGKDQCRSVGRDGGESRTFKHLATFGNLEDHESYISIYT